MALYDYTYVLADDGEAQLRFGTSEVIWSFSVVPESPPPGFSSDDYKAMLSALLPHGTAWPRNSQSTLQKVLASLADEFGRADGRSVDLLAESDPRSSSELLSDWERVCGLPDPCVANIAQSVQQRRAAVEARLTSVGGQSREYYRAYAFRLGYEITIDEFPPFVAGSSAGDQVHNNSWAHTWRINSGAVTVQDFRVGEAAVGEALRTWGNEALECALNKLKPAHTVLLFAYA